MTPRATNAPTLADVAKYIGVSRTTVSNAYNRPDQLSPELRERVLAAAGELGYGGPDPVARSLRRGRAGSLGLVFDHPLRYIFSDPAAILFLSGVAAGCEEHGTGLALVPQLPEGAAEVVRSALVDGYVMFCTPEDDERLQAVIARGLPYVLVDYSPHVPGPHVNIDDRGGARAVAQHLVDLGHRRFGIVLPYEKWGTDIPYGEPEATAETAEAVSRPDLVTEYRRWRCFIHNERLIGWREALEPAGVDWSAVPVASAPGSDAETGYHAGAQLLDRADRPTAIIALSDVLALGVMRAAAERGVRVPQDLSVVGYDDIADAGNAALTTVWQPHAAKGEEAVRLLGEGGDDVVLPTRLVVRASSGPAAH
jgi:DNA-binding LacI/PurR family transcriptional regulator